MRPVTISIALLISAGTLRADDAIVSTYRADLAPTVDQYVERELDALLAYYVDLHQHPELSLHEERTAAKVAGRLESLGYKVTTGIGGHGVVGVMKNGEGPTVLIRGDMDALPVTERTNLPYASKMVAPGKDGNPVGVMHACGHDMHQTCLVGTAGVLAETRKHWRGTVVMLAQPAEEVGKGARMMIEDKLFDRIPRPDFCLALHVAGDLPTGQIGYTPGWALANVDSVDITIHGRGGHGSRPNQTIDPVIIAAHVIVALQTIVSRNVDPTQPAVITVGSVHAGFKHNIISAEAKLQLTVRSYTDETRKTLLDGIRRVTINTCRALGTERDPDVVVLDDEFTPATYNHPSFVAATVGVLERVVGKDQVVARPAVMGGEDFGRYPKQLGVPGFLFWLGSIKRETYDASLEPGAAPLPAMHSPGYHPDPLPTITTGVRAMSLAALGVLGPAE